MTNEDRIAAIAAEVRRQKNDCLHTLEVWKDSNSDAGILTRINAAKTFAFCRRLLGLLGGEK